MDNLNKKGIFIVVEGDDGSGKSTIVDRLAAFLEEGEYSVLKTKEPGGGSLDIRKELFEIKKDVVSEAQLRERETDLFLEDRKLHIQNVVLPALGRGEVVVCDRFTPSTIAYQGYGRGMLLEEIIKKDAEARQGLWPDKIILLDGNFEEFSRRLDPAKLTRFDKESPDFHQKVREGFLAQVKEDPERWCVVNAEQSKEEVWQEVKRCIEKLLQGRV